MSHRSWELSIPWYFTYWPPHTAAFTAYFHNGIHYLNTNTHTHKMKMAHWRTLVMPYRNSWINLGFKETQIPWGSFHVNHLVHLFHRDVRQPFMPTWPTWQCHTGVVGLLAPVLVSVVGVVDHVATDRLNWSLPADKYNTVQGCSLDVSDLREACQARASERALIAS